MQDWMAIQNWCPTNPAIHLSINPFCLPQEVVVAVEPLLGGGVIGTGNFNQVPEVCGVVHLAEVHKLVKDQVVTYERGRLD